MHQDQLSRVVTGDEGQLGGSRAMDGGGKREGRAVRRPVGARRDSARRPLGAEGHARREGDGEGGMGGGEDDVCRGGLCQGHQPPAPAQGIREPPVQGRRVDRQLRRAHQHPRQRAATGAGRGGEGQAHGKEGSARGAEEMETSGSVNRDVTRS